MTSNYSGSAEIAFVDNNLTLNTTNSSINSNSEEPRNTIALIEKYAVPIICVLGLLGNIMSFIVFVQKCLRQKSCSFFLMVRSLSDSGFLITLLIMWTSSVFDLQLSEIVGICQIITFMTYVFGCLSVWLVVFVTTENYIRICKPFRVNTYCQAKKAKYAVIVLTICVLCCYNFPLWTMTKECIPNEKYYIFLKIMVYTDSVFTLVAPTAIMIFLLSRIAMFSISSCKRRRRLCSTSARRLGDLTTKVSTMLLAVTLIFITLNMPLHVVKLRLLIISFIKDQIDIPTPLDLTIQSISQMIYYTSFAINFFVYYIFGGTFRKTFRGIFQEKKKKVLVQNKHSKLSSSKVSEIKQTFQSAPKDRIPCNNLLQLNELEDTRMISSEV